MRKSARIPVLAGHPRWIFFGRLAVLNLATQLCAFSAILTNRRVRRYEPGGTHCRRRTVEKCEKSTAFHSITSSAGRCDRALWLSLGLEANGLDWNATAVGQNSTIALRLHPASSFGGGLCGLGKQSLGVEHSFRIRVPLTVVALTSTHHCTWNSFGRFGGCEATNVMSALSHKRASDHVQSMSALPPKADIGTHSRNVRFGSKADIHQPSANCPLYLQKRTFIALAGMSALGPIAQRGLKLQP